MPDSPVTDGIFGRERCTKLTRSYVRPSLSCLSPKAGQQTRTVSVMFAGRDGTNGELVTLNPGCQARKHLQGYSHQPLYLTPPPQQPTIPSA
jgi:hypothetical protein